MPNGSRQHDRLVAALRRNQPIPADVRRWYLESVRRWEASDQRLEVALGLVRSRDAIALRDASLKEAAKLMPDDWSVRERAKQIEKTARNLATFSDARAVDWENRPAWHEHLWLALDAAPLPGERRLCDLCNFRRSCTKKAAS